MNKNSNENTSPVSISELLLKRVCSDDIEGFEAELKKYSDIHSFDYREVIYRATIKILKDNSLFSKINKEVFDKIFYISALWSSNAESKKKIRPKNTEDAQRSKRNLFVDLQKNLVYALLKKYKNENSFAFKIDLDYYLSVTYELSCVKRYSSSRKEN